MNVGHCETPDCDYTTQPDSDHCLLCEYVMERQQEIEEMKRRVTAIRLQAQATVQIFDELFGSAA